jgi:hypothetical protein
MDPITGIQLVASSAQLAGLAFNVLTNVYKYYRNVREAPARAAELRQELDILVDLLSAAQELFERNPTQVFGATLIQEMSGLRGLLTRLNARTRPQRTAGIRRLQWPFRASKNEEIISKLERYKSNLMILLNLDQM